jgi:hypothetical protein
MHMPGGLRMVQISVGNERLRKELDGPYVIVGRVALSVPESS